MNILVLDSEAYGIEYLLWKASEDTVLARGIVTDVGTRTSILKLQAGGQATHQLVSEIPNVSAAVKWILASLTDTKIGVIKEQEEIAAVGHRVVHGATKYLCPAVVTEEVMRDIGDFADYAPRHNPYNLEGIKAAISLLPEIPHVAVFDTAYYQTLPPKAYLYGLPYKYYSQYGVRKYGFHGPSHRYASERACYLANIPFEEARVISIHLGRGASVTATSGGRCIDTSMGFSPLEGLVMETRCGDIDPEAVIHIMSKEELSLRTLSGLLNRHAGVLGLSGLGDFDEVVSKAQAGDERAQTAIDVFVHRIRKYIGAYLLELGGVDIIVFTAFIAERYPLVRSLTCKDMEFLGVKIDEEVNSRMIEAEGEISTRDSKVKVYCVPHNEELIIARKVYQTLGG